MYEDVTHVVTTDDWGKDFERALKVRPCGPPREKLWLIWCWCGVRVQEHPGLVIARPEWVLECHIQQKRVNTAAYRLSP